ncbi:MAG: multicopper oxidase domain-containing protein [Kineosporiaceae bacterium]
MHLTTSPYRRAGLLSLAASAAVITAAVAVAPAAQAAPSIRAALPVSAALPTAALAPQAAAAISSPHDCSTGSATDRTCDLFAVSSTQTIAGVGIPMWTFTGSASAAPTGTGPVIVANQGDTLHLVLHNQVTCPSTTATDCSLSLAVPGVRGNSSDTAGIVNDATSKEYVFHADKPGTYLYEAGHTKVGPRAVAMGLVGAIVVRPTGYTAGDPTTGTDIGPGSAFADESVMVLTDVDPKLAAAPLTFDLRNFHSTYRLVNGVAYSPSAPKIQTTAGNKVLLRYLNAGMVSHSMGVLNQRQTVVAIDGNADSSGGLVADTLPPGETEDVIVTAPEGETPVYDTSGLLDNGGGLIAGDGTTSGLKRVNFGGMMQMLSTVPTSTISDTVGPKTTITAASPTSVTATFVDQVSPLCTGGNCAVHNVTAAEYFVDAIPGAGGTGTQVAITAPGTVATQTFPVTVTGNGQHHVYVRAQDDQSNWGLPTSALVTVVTSGPTTTGVAVSPAAASVPAGKASVTITASGDASSVSDTVAAMEFFVQPSSTTTQPGATVRGTAMTLNGSGAVVPGSGTFTATTEGTYTVLVRSRGTVSGTWGGFSTATLTVDNTAPTSAGVSGGAVTPNPTDGTKGDQVDPTALKVQATFSDTPATGGTVTTPILAAEGYLPTPSGGPGTQTAPTTAQNGLGFVFQASDATFDGHTSTSSSSELAYGTIPLTQLTQFPQDGTYNVWVHGRDAAGNWGAWVAIPFTVSRTPAVTSATLVQNTVGRFTVTVSGTSGPSALTNVSYVFGGTTAPTGTTGTSCSTGGQTGAFTLTCVANGTVTGNLNLWVRVTNATKSSAWFLATPTLLNSLFSDGFESGTAAAWGASAGSPTFPTVTGMTGARAMLTANNSATSNVTTPTVPSPSAVSYRAGFQFRPNTLRTAAGQWVKILSLRNATNTELASVQYQKTSATGSAVVRVSTPTANSGNVTLAGSGVATVTNVYTIRVAFETSTAAAQGISLYVNSANPSTSLNNASTAGQAVSSAVLGTVGTSPTGGSVTGQAYFDSYSANRFTLP